jgi:protein tyrosine phosphatase (PTP) superfamily phosphohydrolase (DUF442 family)
MAMLATASAPEVLRIPQAKPRRRLRFLGPLGLAALVLFLGHEVGRRLLGWNFHTVIAGRVYRGAQPTPRFIEQLALDHGVRTIINLRGCGLPFDWYAQESQAVQNLGLNLEDICFSATRLPSSVELRRLLEVLDGVAYPVYLHCRRGADRTGMASVIVMLLEPQTKLAQARAQLGLFYGHVAVGGTRVMDQFVDLYEEWLGKQGRAHDSATFRHWLLEEYNGGWCSARFEEVTPLFQNGNISESAVVDLNPSALQPARPGSPLGLRVRVRNTGTKEWRMQVGSQSGVHVGYQVWDGDRMVAEGRGGMMDRRVPRGDSVAVTLVIAPLPRAGKYRLLVDMVEEHHCWFYQAGSEPHEEELVLVE